MLDFDDIQYILLTRAPALNGRYIFLSFKRPAAGRAWLAAMLEKVHSVKAMRDAVAQDKRWVTVAFTWNGLRALGVDEASLATFPEKNPPAPICTPSQYFLRAMATSACGRR